tara:strand:- start:161 stop:439 length:279 start_codon:yes stop_codon:yes gene_type:complete
MTIQSKIIHLIKDSINVIHLDIIDDSHKHAHHKKDTQGGHFRLLVISDDFLNKNLIERHKLIYAILGSMIKIDIHALSMKTLTQDEYNKVKE